MYNIKGGGEWYDASYHGLLVHRDYERKNTKVKVLKDADIDIFVDDKYQNFTELNKEGIFTYLLDRPWNTRYNIGHKRIYSLEEIIKR